MKTTINDQINIIIDEQLNDDGQTRPRQVFDAINERCSDLVDEYAQQLAAQGLMRRIKGVLKGKMADASNDLVSQLHLPGMNVPATITNRTDDDQGDGDFVYIRFDLATKDQLDAYIDEVLQENISNAETKKKDMELKRLYLAPAFEFNPQFTTAEACRWIAQNSVFESPMLRPQTADLTA